MSLLKSGILRKTKGFTLVELLIVIAILAVLFATVLIALNPARQLAQADNTKRRSDIHAILNAVHQYMADNNGSPPTAITTTSSNIGNSGIDICSVLVPTYLAEMPVDPDVGSYTDCSTYNTGYSIAKSATNNRITVTAGSAEISEIISVTR